MVKQQAQQKCYERNPENYPFFVGPGADFQWSVLEQRDHPGHILGSDIKNWCGKIVDVVWGVVVWIFIWERARIPTVFLNDGGQFWWHVMGGAAGEDNIGETIPIGGLALQCTPGLPSGLIQEFFMDEQVELRMQGFAD